MEPGTLWLSGTKLVGARWDRTTEILEKGTFPDSMLERIITRAKRAFDTGNFACVDLLVPRVEGAIVNGTHDTFIFPRTHKGGAAQLTIDSSQSPKCGPILHSITNLALPCMLESLLDKLQWCFKKMKTEALMVSKEATMIPLPLDFMQPS